MPRELKQLSERIDLVACLGGLEGRVRRLAYDSRQVVEGALFVAIPGARQDGRDFVLEALQRGARAVVFQAQDEAEALRLATPWHEAWPASTFLAVRDARAALADLAVAFYREEGRVLRILAVVGRTGTRTLAAMLHRALEAQGQKTGLIDGMRIYIGQTLRYGSRNHPEAPEREAILASLAAAGCDWVIVAYGERDLRHRRAAGLAPQRLLLTTAVEPELLADFDAPGLVRQWVEDDGERLSVLSDPGSEPAQLAWAVEPTRREGRLGVQFQATIAGQADTFFLAQPTRFMLANALQLLAAAPALGLDEAALLADFGEQSVRGHLERVDNARGLDLYIDEAWTAAELEGVLTALRPWCSGRLIVVAGSGGDREPKRREAIGRMAARHADLAILTTSHPRSEGGEAVVADLARGAEGEAGRVLAIPARDEAIARAVAEARPGDLVLIAGRGSESFYMLSDRTELIDDRTVLEGALQALADEGQTS